MACDVCGKVDHPLIDLVPELRTKVMAAICRDCETWSNKRLDVLRSRAIKAAWRKLRIEMGRKAK